MRLRRLRDDQWDRIKDDLPGQAGSAGATAVDNRMFVDALLYRYRTGIVPVCPGAICRKSSEVGKTPTVGSAAGPKAVYGP